MHIYTAEEIEELSERQTVSAAYHMLGHMRRGFIGDQGDFGDAMVALSKKLGFAALEENLEKLCIERGWIEGE